MPEGRVLIVTATLPTPVVSPVPGLVMAAAVIADAGWLIGPRPMPCVCGADRGRHTGPDLTTGGCAGYVHDPADALACAAVDTIDNPMMDDISEYQDARHVPSGGVGPRVSDVGRCGRQVWYREHPPAGYTPAPVSRRAATLGTIIDLAARKAREAKYPWRYYQMRVQVPGLDRPGFVDEYDPVTGTVIDGKTCGDGKWEWYGDEGPPEDAWAQLSVYGYALEEAGWPVQVLRVVGINRSTGEEESFHRPYRPAAALTALDQLVDLGTVLDLGLVPERAADASGPSRFPCSWCEARNHCWNTAAAAAAGRSPESYTRLGPTPTDETIGWAARNLMDARKTGTAADKRAKEYVALLDGIPGGEYDGLEVTPGGRFMPEYKAGWNLALGYLDLPDEQRPTADQVERQLPKRRDKTIGVKPVRAATKDPGRQASRRRKKTAEPTE